MNRISYSVGQDNKIYVDVPLLLWPHFRYAFKTSIWLNTERKWIVNNTKTTINKLDTFKQIVHDSGILDSLAQADELDFVDREISTLRAQISETQRSINIYLRDIEALPDKVSDLEKLRAIFQAKQLELRELVKRKDIETAEIEKERAEFMGYVERFIDITFITNTHSEMCKLANSIIYIRGDYRNAKDRFKELQEELLLILDELSEINVTNSALYDLAYANPNRLERDNPNHITKKALLNFVIKDNA